MLRGILAGAFWGVVAGALILLAAAFAIEGRQARDAATLTDPVSGELAPVETGRLAASPAVWPMSAGESTAHAVPARRAKPALPDLRWPERPMIALDPPHPARPRAVGNAPASGDTLSDARATRSPARPPPLAAGDDTVRAPAEVSGLEAPGSAASADRPATDTPISQSRPPARQDEFARAPDIALAGSPSQPVARDIAPVAPDPPAGDSVSDVAPPAAGIPHRAPSVPALADDGAVPAPGPARPMPGPDLGALAWPGPHVALIGPGDAAQVEVPVYATLAAAGPDLPARLAAIAERARRDGAVAIRVSDDPALAKALEDWMAREGLARAPAEALPILWDRAGQGT